MIKNKKQEKTVRTEKSITFLPANRVCTYKGFASILEIAIAHSIPLNHSCGGMGSCTTCRVFVTKGADRLKPPEDVEAEHARMRGYAFNERLACQTLAENDIEVTIPIEDDLG